MSRNVASRYAEALYSVASKGDTIQSVEDDLNGIAQLMESDKAFRELMKSPIIARTEKAAILDKLFSDRVTAITMQVIRLLLNKRREGEMVSLRDEFVKLRRKKGNVLYVHVTSAEELSSSQKDALISKMSTGGKAVEADFSIDKSLIAGVKVSYDNFVLDGSVRGGLNRLRESLKRDLLKQA